MSSKHKKTFNRRQFESDIRKEKDVFAALYQSMLLSDAYRDLTHRQKTLYTYCRLQECAISASERSKIKSEIGIDIADNRYFTMNKSKLTFYSLYSPKSLSPFYSDMKSLEEHGFITCVYSGKQDRKKSVYAYSAKWLEWHSATDNFPTTPTDTLRKV